MEKKKKKSSKSNLKKRWIQRKVSLREKNINLAHPVVKASYTWSIISDQLQDMLGPEIHHQWFKQAKPVVISDNVLILEVPNHFFAQWIHTHYHELIDLLIKVIDKNLSSFFVSRFDMRQTIIGTNTTLFESTTTKINRQPEDE
jgi:chromosomal replication initiation ATPase DnaA